MGLLPVKPLVDHDSGGVVLPLTETITNIAIAHMVRKPDRRPLDASLNRSASILTALSPLPRL
jgi:hypothetical protein